MKISAIVLAAGESKRFGSDNKLLAIVDGLQLVRRVVAHVLAAKVDDVVVVTGHQAEDISAVVSDLDVRVVTNDNYLAGMGSSIAKGVSEARDDAGGYLIIAGDMVNFEQTLINSMIEFLTSPKTVVVCRSKDYEGHPVLFGSSYRVQLMALEDREGARKVWKGCPNLQFFDVPTHAVRDIDTVSDLITSSDN